MCNASGYLLTLQIHVTYMDDMRRGRLTLFGNVASFELRVNSRFNLAVEIPLLVTRQSGVVQAKALHSG
jgi:hypothetical protein